MCLQTLCFSECWVNIVNVWKNAHKKATSDLDDARELTNFSNPDLAEELSETAPFCGQEKRVSNVEKSLVISHGVGSIDLFF